MLFGRGGQSSLIIIGATTLGYDMAYVLGTAGVSKMSWLWCDDVVAVIVVIIVVKRPIRGKISKNLQKMIGYYVRSR